MKAMTGKKEIVINKYVNARRKCLKGINKSYFQDYLFFIKQVSGSMVIKAKVFDEDGKALDEFYKKLTTSLSEKKKKWKQIKETVL